MTTATYNVQQGDTLGHIAQRFGISSAELQRLNPFISKALAPSLQNVRTKAMPKRCTNFS